MSVESILSELYTERARIDAAIKALELIATKSTGGESTGVRKPRKKRVLSADARKRIADAQRKRWAAQKAKR